MSDTRQLLHLLPRVTNQRAQDWPMHFGSSIYMLYVYLPTRSFSSDFDSKQTHWYIVCSVSKGSSHKSKSAIKCMRHIYIGFRGWLRMIEAAFSVPRMQTSSMGWCWAWPSVLLLHEPVMQMCEMTWASWYVELYDSTRVSHLITTECCYKLWILDGSLHIDPSGKPNLLDISNEVRVHASSSYKLSRFKLNFVFFHSLAREYLKH